ncbi:MAG: polysaccharide biosynthesis tyrosine autokinase [Ruminococcus sp.]|nr:polysaccharide biosynthesis tyrosine autokinase [Ruminococcus sp.]
MGNENEYSLKSIFQLVIGKWWLILILAIVGAGAAFGFSKYVMPLEYRSYTSMYVKNNNTVTGDAVNLNDLNASKSLVSTYIAVLQDDAVLDEVGNELLKKYPVDKLKGSFSIDNEKKTVGINSIRDCLTMSSVDDTEVLKIVAVTKDPALSADLCNIIADIAPDFLVRVVGAGSVEAIGPAKIYAKPISPNIPKNTVVGMLAGIMIAVLLIFVFDFFDNTVKDTELLNNKYNKPVVGEIHRFTRGKKKKNEKDERKTLLSKDFPFHIVESYKAMRTNLIFSLSTSDKKIFAISSPNPSEGKSTTAANIAITLAQADNKVLLIDADMRKPVQHNIFQTKNKVGFSSVISKMETSSKCIHKNVVKNLDLLPTGPKPPNPSELLASEQTEKLLEELSDKYDYIIIDTPPVNVVTDAMGVSKSVAGIFLILKYGSTTFDEAEQAMKTISLANMNMLGFIMNDIKNKGNGSTYYKSKYSDYGYGEEPKEKSDKENK